MKQLLAFLLMSIILAGNVAAQSAKVSAKDLKPLEGNQWVGDLTYLDYQSKELTSIKTNVIITRDSTDKLKWIFTMQYPLEPKANRTEDLVLSPDGLIFDGENVVERKKLPSGVLKVITTKPGKGRQPRRDYSPHIPDHQIVVFDPERGKV